MWIRPKNEFKFGSAITSIGDLNGDGNVDIAVGNLGDDDGSGSNRGAIWILFLNSDATVLSYHKISAVSTDLASNLDLAGDPLDANDNFGVCVDSIGDVNGDNIVDLAVGAYRDDDGGSNRGSVYVLFMDTDGTVKSHQKISTTQGNFNGVVDNNDQFGIEVANAGDVNFDGVPDLFVGEHLDDDNVLNNSISGRQSGAFWLLFLNSDGTVLSEQKYSATTQGLLADAVSGNDRFGRGIASLGDINGDCIADLLVGASRDDETQPDNAATSNEGCVWFLELGDAGACRVNPQGGKDNDDNPYAQEELQVAVMAYPNPVTSILNMQIDISTKTALPTQITLVNIMGQVVLEWKGEVKGETTQPLDISRLVDGHYIATVIVGEKLFSEKIVAQR